MKDKTQKIFYERLRKLKRILFVFLKTAIFQIRPQGKLAVLFRDTGTKQKVGLYVVERAQGSIGGQIKGSIGEQLKGKKGSINRQSFQLSLSHLLSYIDTQIFKVQMYFNQ